MQAGELWDIFEGERKKINRERFRCKHWSCGTDSKEKDKKKDERGCATSAAAVG